MSRIGKKPIAIPSGVTVSLNLPEVSVKGPKGTMSRTVPTLCTIEQKDGRVVVSRTSDDRIHRSMHGLTRTLIANMVEGVSTGFSKELEIIGVGYKAEARGRQLILTLGFSHPVNMDVPEGVIVETPEPTKVKISGYDKEKVGQLAANIRGIRPPEPYKGKGIKYAGEFIKRKAGKTAAG